jgi:hypothetical protein
MRDFLRTKFSQGWAAQSLSLGTRVLKSGLDSLGNEGSFPLRDCPDDLENHFAVRKGGIDRLGAGNKCNA